MWKGRDVARVQVDVLDLSRVVTAAADPDLSIESTIRGADGTLTFRSYSDYCDIRCRSYQDGDGAGSTIRREKVRDLSEFLNRLLESHPLADTGDDPGSVSMPDVCEMSSFVSPNTILTLSPYSDRIVVTAEESSPGSNQIEKVTVPIDSFANLLRLAGGDLPGRGSFETMRGHLRFHYDRRAALKLRVETDEVDDGTMAIVALDTEQVQELRQLVPAWRRPPTSS